MVNQTAMNCWNTLIELKARKASISDAFTVYGFDFGMINNVINEGKRIKQMESTYNSNLAYNESIVEVTNEDGTTYMPEEKELVEPTSDMLDVETILNTYIGLD